MAVVGGWRFDTTYTSLPGAFYRRLEPMPVARPKLVLFNEALARELGLDADGLQTEKGAALFAGNELPKDATPLAMAYAGHQFGGFTMLGDGRALLVGEHVTPDGCRVDVQLKGSGPTPYSRGGDGRAALGPMLREYVISEAMHRLGVPTTRSLAVATTGEPVFRERPLQGAVLTRIAASHVRVGTFQFARAWHGPDGVRALADYVLHRHFPDVAEADDRYVRLLHIVAEEQADLVARWLAIGFVHGVMNTDNVSIAGETIDYGPCAFLDAYDPLAVFSSIDHEGRYAYGRQPPIAQWNLARFSETLLPLLHEDETKAIDVAQEVVSEFPALFRRRRLAHMGAKIGLADPGPEDAPLIDDLLALMARHRADFTNAFRTLLDDWRAFRGREDERTSNAAEGAPKAEGPALVFHQGAEALRASSDFDAWRERWLRRLQRGEAETARAGSDGTSGTEDGIALRLQRSNPAVIPRNHRVEEALEAAEHGDFKPLKRLLHRLARPYDAAEEEDWLVTPPPKDAPAYVTFCGT